MIPFVKHACWLAMEPVIVRYLISVTYGRWSGYEKAIRHGELCSYYVALFRGCSVDDADNALTDELRSTSRFLTDNLDLVIGFPVEDPRPDYDKFTRLFFDRFHAHAITVLKGWATAQDLREESGRLDLDVEEQCGFYTGVRWHEIQMGISPEQP